MTSASSSVFASSMHLQPWSTAGADRISRVDLVSATIDDQVSAFRQMVMSNSIIATIVERMPRLALPGCYLAAGALYQTVWNRLCGRDPHAGIEDYDIN